MKGAPRKPGQGWRVPALEIERNLAAAIAGILDERTAIVADVDEAGVGAHDITSILATAAEWSTRLRSEAEAATALKTLVERAELHPGRDSTIDQIADCHFRQTDGERYDPLVDHASDTTASETAWD